MPVFWTSTMSLSDSPDALAFDRDLPTTAEDVNALRRLGRVQPRSLEDYIRFLEALDPPTVPMLRSRKGPSGSPLNLLP